jgi:small conductance mechanosensitive channel
MKRAQWSLTIIILLACSAGVALAEPEAVAAPETVEEVILQEESPIYETVWEQISEYAVMYGMNILGAILTLVLGIIAAKLIRSLLFKVLQKARLEATINSFMCKIGYFLLMIFVAIATLQQLGVQTMSLITAVGAAGLAVGLALQGALTNFAAGMLLVMLKPFKVGDYIQASGESGTVIEIGILTTIIQSMDNKRITLPNGALTNGNIVNYSANATRRVDLVAGVSYSDDLDKTRTVLMDVMTSNPLVLKSPEPFVGVLEMADSSVNFAVRPWCKSADYWTVYFQVNEAIKKALDNAEISIPFPQRDVHIINPTSE